MTEAQALAWLAGKRLALRADADAALAREHERFLAEIQQALDAIWQQWGIGNTWAVTDIGYPARLTSLMTLLGLAIGAYTGGVKALALHYGDRAWRFDYYGQAWLLAAKLPEATLSLPGRSAEAVAGLVSAPIEGVDLAAAIENIRIDFLQRARREMILSQVAGEGYRQVRERLLAVAGITERVAQAEAVQEAARPKVRRATVAQIVKRAAQKRTGALAKARPVVQNVIVRAAAIGAEDMADDNMGLIDGFVWHVSHFSNVCDRCQARDKKWYPSYKEKPPLHLHCACSSNAQAKSPEDLGMGAVPGPLSVRPYGEWAQKAGVGYDGGLAALPMRVKGAKWRVRTPRASTQTRRNVAPAGWQTGERWGQEGNRRVDRGDRLENE